MEIGSGLRTGELPALRVQDCDLHVISMRQKVFRSKAWGEVIEETLKTVPPRRAVTLPPFVCEVLAREIGERTARTI